MTQYDVFLSYSRKDIEVMRRVANLLRTHGARVWVDENLEVGSEDWKRIVERAIMDSRSLVAILSPDAKKSKWVLSEISRAHMHDLQIFPLLIRGEPRDSVPFGLENANWMDARTNLHAMTDLFAQNVCQQLGIKSTEHLIRQVKRLEREMESQQDMQDKLRQQLAERDAQIATLDSRLRQNDNMISKLTHQVHKLESDNYALQDELERLRAVAPDPDTPIAKFVARSKAHANAHRSGVAVAEVPHDITEHAEFESIYALVKDTQSDLERTSQMFALSEELPRLHAKSILDWFILLWWYFFRPFQIERHKLLYGPDSLVVVRSWLVSTLMWGALFIPLLGAFLGTIAIREDFTLLGQSLASPIWIIGAAIAWAIMGAFGRSEGGGLGFNLALLVIGVVTGFTAFAIMLGIPLGETVALAFFVVLGVLFAVQGVAAFLLAFLVTFMTFSSLTLGLPSISLLGTALLTTLLLAGLVTLMISSKHERRWFSFYTVLSSVLFTFFLGTYAFLAGVYWMGIINLPF